MPKYLIERQLPGAGGLSPADLQGISRKSCDVLQTLGPEIQWVQSYVTDDALYCVYVAPNEEVIREHARAGGLPVTRITPIRTGHRSGDRRDGRQRVRIVRSSLD